MLLLLQLLLQREPAEVAGRHMLIPGTRLVEAPGVLNFVDGRRVVSVEVGAEARATIRAILGLTADPAASGGSRPGGAGDADGARDDAHRLLDDLHLLDATAPAPGTGEVGASFTTATAGGRIAFAQAQERLATTTVHVLGDEDEDLVDELTACGLRCERLPDPGGIADLDPALDLVVAVAEPARPARTLRQVDVACQLAGVTWFPVSAFDGAVLRLGPLVVPGSTACFACTERRLAANVEYAHLYREIVADAPAAPAPRALRSWGFALAALSVLGWVAGRDHRVPGRLLTLDPNLMQVRTATVFRVPRCAVCAAPDHLVAAAPWAIARDH